MSGDGLAALEYGGRVDFARLRAERRRRLLAAVREAGLDALLLGREANARYAAGARRLWTAGSRPFSPGCVVLAGSGAVHLVSSWRDGIPEEVSEHELVGASWSPERLVASLPDLRGARRVGVDGMSPVFAPLLEALLPSVEWVDATPLLERVRRRKTRDELDCIRTAVAVAEGALAAVLPELRPGARERTLLGRFHAEAARLGVTTPSFEGSLCSAVPGEAPPRRLTGSDQLGPGELVLCDVGLLYAGYEGGVGRTAATGTPTGAQRDLVRRAGALRDALTTACVPGAPPAAVCDVYADAGLTPPPGPVLHGVGLGLEPPAAPGAVPDAAPLEPDMVVSVSAVLSEPGVGSALLRDLVHVAAGGPERLTRLPDVPSTGVG